MSRARRPDATLPLVDGRYEILGSLGAGASGTVWAAHDHRLDRPVALKEVARSRLSNAFPGKAEAETAARITHHSTVRIYDIVRDEPGDRDWIVMEALSGRSLASVIGHEGRIGVAETRFVVERLLHALHAVHEAGLVHRDVKPSNIQLCEDGRVVLCDFGLARTPSSIGGARTEWIAGSLPYIAPEILESGTYSAASDIYALGVTAVAAVTGRVPVSAAHDMLRDHRPVEQCYPLPDDAAELRSLIHGLLAADPGERLTVIRALMLLERSQVRVGTPVSRGRPATDADCSRRASGTPCRGGTRPCGY